MKDRNWAGNLRYQAKECLVPEHVEQVQEWVARSGQIKTLGSRHSFNEIADCTGSHISLEKLNRIIALDREKHQITVEGGIRYGELCQYLHQAGYALHNLASLPHITVAGACATATHGSGDQNGNLATVVASLEVAKADGETVTLSRGNHPDFAGAAVNLGAIGIVTKLTLDLIPAFQMRQHVYERLHLEQLEANFDAIFSSAYSVSLFTDWREPIFNQVWLKEKLTGEDRPEAEATRWGAALAKANVHPVPGMEAEPCSAQMGIPGAWHDRLPHFRFEFQPSAGDELQSEYFVPREQAYAALSALSRIRSQIAPLLHISEIRTIAADELWMSPCCQQHTVGIHFTWKADWEAVRAVLPLIEAELEPFGARPHWGKLFTMPASKLKAMYAKLPDFQKLVHRYDPSGKFANAFIRQYIREA
ncbi:FAD-binding protein [Xylanibacillus composti]|uniref:Putative xylitol oxidase n=1 Tax=Xylanibacillus composti TaxID=1572762 RepID=A0A8J4M2H8_9BACL|nr:FAD-binding protein [Xylanibacillus composti]MDT9725376.1 FAD-binding protein [Xylanibacillus composti]GIQ69140.1 putative xylitol oxidase [Xylanibacillus composti]